MKSDSTRYQKELISNRMRRVQSVNTPAESAFRCALWKKGFRYKIAPSNLPGKPDIVLPSHRLAIFIDGDFWHGNQWRNRNLRCLADQFEKTESKGYWLTKINGNIRRDFECTKTLLNEKWIVLRFWESSILSNLNNCLNVTLRTMKGHPKMNEGHSLLPRKTFAEFFAGIGLVRSGLEKGGWKAVFANDIDAKKFEMYAKNFDDDGDVFVLGDVHKLSSKLVPPVTMATASFPCNDLSLAGSRNGLMGKQSSAYWGFTRVIKQMGESKPPILLLENVPGLLTSKGGEDLHAALMELNRLGYAVDIFLIDAANFVPQSRQRLFIVGTLKGIHGSNGKSSFDMAMQFDNCRPKKVVQFIGEYSDVDWHIRQLPPPPQMKRRLDDILEDIPNDSDLWWNELRTKYLLNQMSHSHRKIVSEMISARRWSYGTAFRRIRNSKSMAEVRVDGIAGCLRTPRGGSARQILIKAGFGKVFIRLLTPRECARLMGADDYEISVPLNQALFGFGDAVCVPVIEWISQNYLDPLLMESIRGRPLCPLSER